MPGTGKYTTVEPPMTEYGKGSSGTNILKKLFKTSPLYGGSAEIDVSKHSLLVEFAKKLLVPSVQADGSNGEADHNDDFPNGVSLDYAGVPDVSNLEVNKGGGDPSTPWTPNLNSVGEGNGVDPTKQEPMDSESLPKPAEGNIVGIGGLVNPSVSSVEISSGELGTVFPLGSHNK